MAETERFTGADLNGTSGDKDRVLTLTNTSITVSEGFLVFVGGLHQVLDSDYTVSHSVSGTTITFLGNTYDDSLITVVYYTRLSPSAASGGAIPLDARFIQKNITAVGNTCTVTQIAVTTGTDEYRTKSEVETDNTSIPCFVHVLSYEDEQVKSGDARAGDLVFWFDASYESILARSGNNKVRITWNSNTYEVKNVKPFKAVGDTLMLIECAVEQI